MHCHTSIVYCCGDDQADELGNKPNESSQNVQVLMLSQGIKLGTCIHVSVF